MSKILKNILYCLLGTEMLIIISSFINGDFLLLLGGAAAVIFALVLIYKVICKMSDVQLKLTGFFALIIMLVGLLYFGIELAVEPSWDFGRVYAGALDIAQNHRLTYTLPYYLESYNNFFITWVLSYWFKICSLAKIQPLYAGIFLNAAAIWVSAALMQAALKIHFNLKISTLFSIMTAMFLPLYTYAPVFYTDTLSLPFVCAIVLMFALWLKKRPCGAKAVLFYMAFGLITFLGYKTKASAAILTIAAVIIMLLKDYKAETKAFVLTVLFCVLSAAAYNTIETKAAVIDKTEIDLYRLPKEHYVMMGLCRQGGYSAEDHELSSSIIDIEQRKAAEIEVIKERLSEYGLVGYAKFLLGKISYTWTDGTYYAPMKLNIDPINNNFLSSVFTFSGKHYQLYAQIMKAVQLALMLLIAFSSKKDDLTLMMSLSMLGIFLFLLVWETRSRYIVNFIPVFLAISALSTDNLIGRIGKLK